MLGSPCLFFPSLSLSVFLFAFLPCVSHSLSVRTSGCSLRQHLDHFLVPVKAYQYLVVPVPSQPSQQDTRAIRFTYKRLLISEHFDKTQCLTFGITEPARGTHILDRSLFVSLLSYQSGKASVSGKSDCVISLLCPYFQRRLNPGTPSFIDRNML